DRIVLAFLRFTAVGAGLCPGVVDPVVGTAFLPPDLTVGLDPVTVIVRLAVEVGGVSPTGVLGYEEHLLPTADGLVVVVLARRPAALAVRQVDGVFGPCCISVDRCVRGAPRQPLPVPAHPRLVGYRRVVVHEVVDVGAVLDLVAQAAGPAGSRHGRIRHRPGVVEDEHHVRWHPVPRRRRYRGNLDRRSRHRQARGKQPGKERLAAVASAGIAVSVVHVCSRHYPAKLVCRMTAARSSLLLRAVIRYRCRMQVGCTGDCRWQPGQPGASPMFSMKYCGVPAMPSTCVALVQPMNAGSSALSSFPSAGAGVAHSPLLQVSDAVGKSASTPGASRRCSASRSAASAAWKAKLRSYMPAPMRSSIKAPRRLSIPRMVIASSSTSTTIRTAPPCRRPTPRTICFMRSGSSG